MPVKKKAKPKPRDLLQRKGDKSKITGTPVKRKPKAKGYPKLTAAQERQIRSEQAFVAKSASTTAKKAKPKAKPKKNMKSY